MAIVIIDGQEIEIGDDERLNGIQAARRAGVEIPHYCWHPGLSVVGSCRMCLVEMGTRNPKTGQITMTPKLVPACQMAAKDGTVFVTQSEKVRKARAMVEECLLYNHPIDCPICDKAGECFLQDYHFRHGQEERRADLHPFTSRRRDVGPTVTLFVDRCILCSRCVRFTREISGTSELMVVHRGDHEEIDVLPEFPLANRLSGNVVDLCPVGALCDKDFLYQQRVWYLRQHASVCPGCATGCSIWIEENQDHVYRLKPRVNSDVNRWWMCDEGRYGYHHVHDPNRLTVSRRRDGQTETVLEWQAVLEELPAALAAAGRMAVVLSPYLSVEEAYLLATWARRIDPEAVLAMGPVPVQGQDERFPGGFTIRAEKCPNRRGVQKVLAHFDHGWKSFEEFLKLLDAGQVKAAWVSGGYPSPWIDDRTARRFDPLGLLVVQDLFDSPLARRATYELPGAAFAERDGSYVNCADRLQQAEWAVRPPAGVRAEGDVYWRLLGMEGLYDARRVLDRMACEIIAMAVAAGPIPPEGVDLKLNLLAGAK
jgi:NADH-quinone oxidoreductase subunit G